MSIFKKAILTRAGKALIAKTQAKRGITEFTKAVSGSGVWEMDEDLETADELREPVQEFNFSGIDIPDGNPAQGAGKSLLCHRARNLRQRSR